MGELLQGHCKCGYKSPLLCVGVGMMIQPARTPAPCFICKKVIEITAQDAAPKCPHCRKAVRPYGLPPTEPPGQPGDANPDTVAADESSLTDSKWECPRCRKHELTFRWGGCWD